MRNNTLMMTAALGLVLSGGANAQNAPQALVDASYAALGMNDRYAGEGSPPDQIVTAIVRGTSQAFDPGESDSVADPLKPDWGTSTFVKNWDVAQGEYRAEWVRPRAGGGMRTYTEVYTAEGGYVTGQDVNGALPARTVQGSNPPAHTMSALRLRTTLREQERYQIVFDAHRNPDQVSAYTSQTINGKTYPAVEFTSDNGIFIIMFDPDTKLPAVVRTRDFDAHYGDSDYDATYTDWRDVGKFKQPFHIVYTLNGVKIFDETITQMTVNTPQGAGAYTAPASLRGKAPKPAAANRTPWQWIIRRMGNGFYLDSDALYTDDNGQLALTDVGPNISMVTGGSHNTLVVATSDSLVIFEAPGDDGLANWTLNAAAQKYPGKPVRYVVLTHHHIDHTGGIRAYAAAGAAIVVGKGNGDFFKKALAAPQATNLYGTKSVAPNVIEVDGKWSVTVGGRTVEAYSLDTAHATGYLIPYVPDAKMGFVTDLWNPGPAPTASNPNLVAIVRGMEKAGITPDKFAGGHGAVGSYADVARVVGPAR